MNHVSELTPTNRALVAAFFLIEDPINVVREGGQHIAMFQPPTLKNEVKGILSVMIDPKVVILLPAMFVAEMCLALTSSINGGILFSSTSEASRLC